jgi:predicted nucleic acid-binding protein
VEKLAGIRTERISLVTSDYVLDESITIIRLRVSHKAAVAFGQSIFGSSVVDLIPVGADDRRAAWEIFRKYADQEFSFTDCTSFALMRKLRLRTALTFDGHFSQMGFGRF